MNIIASLLSFLLITAYADPPIHVYIHTCTIANWQEILEEQLARLQKSGLYDACDGIHLGVLGSGDIRPITNAYPKISILYQHPNTQLYERPTLLNLHYFAISNPDALILYFHTKGVTKVGNPNVTDWRRYMEYFAIDLWKDCVATLTMEGYDICGVNWYSTPKPHFSGNFWWATAKYICTLPHHIGKKYLDPEMWLGQNSPMEKSFFQSCASPVTPCPEEIYKHFSIAVFSSQIADLLSGKISPDFSLSCVDTPENRMHVIEEIANLYGHFLTYQAHEKEHCSKLRAKGMWLEVKDADDYFPPQEKIREFVLNLRQVMEADLLQRKEWGATTKLGIDYSPDHGALSEAFQKTGLDIRCNMLLPYKSLTYLEVKENQLQIHIWLKGPLL